MRSRSVSRRSAPSISAVEGSLSRMRSRSAHRELEDKDWVSPAPLTAQLAERRDRCLSLCFRAMVGCELFIIITVFTRLCGDSEVCVCT